MTVQLSNLLHDAPPPCPILVVDDDEVIREHLSIHLGRAGYPVITAASGREALELIAAERCEAVIADWEMPDINGPALCRRIRSSQRNRRLYVLMFTVRDECDDVVAGLNSGADDYIVKGAPVTELIARLESGRRLAAGRLRPTTPASRRLQWLADVYPTPEEPRSSRPQPELAFALAREFDRCRRNNSPLSLILCAPDNVAGLNESLGPDISSAFLSCVRAAIPKHLLESEWVAPCGCEGFLVVLPDMGLDGARLVAQKIRGAMVEAGANLATTGTIRPTVSIGIACVESPRHLRNLHPRDLLKASEQCLAQSRAGGGDCTSAARVSAES